MNFYTKKTKGNYEKILKNGLMYGFLIIYALISLYPLIFALISSFKTDADIFLTPFSLPKAINFQSYIRAWTIASMGVYFKNSVVLSVFTVILLAFTGTMVSYIFAKFHFKLKKTLYLYFLLGMMIPVHSTIIPLAYMIGNLKLRDNFAVIVLLFTAFQIPMTVFILTGFMKSIPGEIEEAAIIDGCSVFRVYRTIILPMSVPAIVTVSIFNFLGAWNNLLIPLIFISKNSLKPLAIGLLTFFAEKTSDYSGVMAAIVITSVLPFIAYVFLQEKVERGLTAGAVKG